MYVLPRSTHINGGPQPTVVGHAQQGPGPAPAPLVVPNVARKMSLTAEASMTQSEKAIVRMFDPAQDPDGLDVRGEIEAYQECARLEGLGKLDPEVGGYCRLANPQYVIERESRRAHGHVCNHPAGDLLQRLMDAYFIGGYHTNNPPWTFSEYLASITLDQLKALWRMDGCSDEYANEIARRFDLGVRMLDLDRRKKYEVKTLNGKLYWEKWLANGHIDASSRRLDTTPDGDFFARKHQGTDKSTGDRLAIWALSKEKKLYTHASKAYRFHHSSFTAGDYIICAGEWSVADGGLKWISARSGHYRPSMDQMKLALTVLANNFGVRPSEGVQCRLKPGGAIKNVPAQQFMFESTAALASRYQLF
jgi:hypothetical protein